MGNVRKLKGQPPFPHMPWMIIVKVLACSRNPLILSMSNEYNNNDNDYVIYSHNYIKAKLQTYSTT